MREKEMETSDREHYDSTSYSLPDASTSQVPPRLARDRKARRPDKVLYVPRAKRQGGVNTKSSADENSEKLTECDTAKTEVEMLSKSEEPDVPSSSDVFLNCADPPDADVIIDESKKRPCEDELTINHDEQIAKDQILDQTQFSVVNEGFSDASFITNESASQEIVIPEVSDLPLEETNSLVLNAVFTEQINQEELIENKEILNEPLCTSNINEITVTNAVETVSTNTRVTAERKTSTLAVDAQTSAGHLIQMQKPVKKRRASSTKEDSWDAKFDDNGDCLDPSILEEVTGMVGNVAVTVPEIDYYTLETKEPDLNDEVFGHILEIYNFPIEYKTQDLISAFHPFKDRGFSIKWVDDTHALAIFGSRLIADEAVNMVHPIIKTRPMAQATLASKRKAKHSSEFLQPYKERPQTSTLMVHRLLSGALGMALPISKQKRDEEGKKIKDAIERKRLANKQRNDAWEGVLGSSD